MQQNTIENTNFIVTEEWNDTRLDVFIFKMCGHLVSRSHAAKLIQNQKVHVNDKLRKASFILKTGEMVTIDLSIMAQSSSHPKAENIPLSIIYEDEHILVIDKPAGLVVHPGAGISSGTLVNALLAHCGGGVPSLAHPERAGIVHRLDRDTSGVMVTAKTQLALTRLSEQFAEHSHSRIYHAICYGTPVQKTKRIETGYGRDPHNRLKYKVLPVGMGKRAALFYQVLKSICKEAFSLVECTLETGRTHQIRVQMAHLKHGVVGDALYAPIPGRFQNNSPEFQFIKKYAKRQLLHAVLLEITHPVTKERMQFEAPYSEDFAKFMEHIW